MFGRIRHGVAGHAQVLELGPSPKGARQAGKRDVEYRFALKVTAGSHDPYIVEHVEALPHTKAPALGNVLPVVVSPKDPKKLRIAWDEVPDAADRVRASAAAAQRGDAAGAAERGDAAGAAERGDAAGAAEALGFTLRDEP